jgi:hypothetical protein
MENFTSNDSIHVIKNTAIVQKNPCLEPITNLRENYTKISYQQRNVYGYHRIVKS